jgi:hypothetical protein
VKEVLQPDSQNVEAALVRPALAGIGQPKRHQIRSMRLPG